MSQNLTNFRGGILFTDGYAGSQRWFYESIEPNFSLII
jgi:hypothetical protein